MNRGPATDRSEPTETFDLDDWNEIFCRTYQVKEDREMASLAGVIEDRAITAIDSIPSSDDRLAATLDVRNTYIYCKVIVPLNSCISQAQWFNIEKKFGFIEESYEALDNNDRKRRGEHVPSELPLSIRQKWNDPHKLTESASKQDKINAKKKLGTDKALGKFQRNCRLGSKAIQELGVIINSTDKSIELPSLPAELTYRNVVVPQDIPDHIRQRFFDANSALEEIRVLIEQKGMIKKLCLVRNAVWAWYGPSHGVRYV